MVAVPFEIAPGPYLGSASGMMPYLFLYVPISFDHGHQLERETPILIVCLLYAPLTLVTVVK